MLRRSKWKGPFIAKVLLNEVFLQQKKIIQTQARESVIMPFLLGRTLKVYNGKLFIPVFIREEMIGRRLGEFIPTRLRHIYKKKKKNGTKVKSK